jgi:hypothetical protein
MAVHLYFSLIPEGLVASMLSPAEFGQYYATGRRYKTRGQAAFVEVDPGFRHAYFPIDEAVARCVPHPDGRPKNSVYISTYRVLEHLPLSALGDLHLVTAYGQTLPLKRAEREGPDSPGPFHLYQDLAPVNSLVAASLKPRAFYDTVVTRPSKFIRFPALAFVELGMGELARNPETANLSDLPYSYVHHLRESLLELDGRSKQTKLVARVQAPDFLYRMVSSGFYVGNGEDFACFPMPSHAEVRREHPQWWRTANQ